jgi:hypothetical protein
MYLYVYSHIQLHVEADATRGAIASDLTAVQHHLASFQEAIDEHAQNLNNTLAAAAGRLGEDMHDTSLRVDEALDR